MKKGMLAVIATALVTSWSQGAVPALAIYDAEGAGAAYLSKDVDMNSTAGAIQPGPGLAPLGFVAVPIGAPSAFGVNAFYTASDKATALANSDYFFFTIAAGVGYDLSFAGTNLTFISAPQPSSLVSNLAIYTSINGGASTQLGSDIAIPSGGANYTLSLNALGTVSDSVSFAFLVWDNESSTDSATLFDNIFVQGVSVPGTSAVPEPTTALMGLALCGVVTFPRRRP